MARICVSCLVETDELPSGDNDHNSSEEETILDDEDAGSRASGDAPENELETSTNHSTSTPPELRSFRIIHTGEIMAREKARGVDDAWSTIRTTPVGSRPGDPLGLGSVAEINPAEPGMLCVLSF
jgi:hypothetical protein